MNFQSKIIASAPSNIALIKYMGKIDGTENLPENPSLSLTLNKLRTEIQWTLIKPNTDFDLQFQNSDHSFHSEIDPSSEFLPHTWSSKSEERFSRHIERCLKEMPNALNLENPSSLIRGTWSIQSANTFPEASGIASSASSFAALTLLVFAFLNRKNPECISISKQPSVLKQLSAISRKGSGSSCRSLLGPWVLWNHDQVDPLLETQFKDLTDFVILIDDSAKSVPSSVAHLEIKSSPLWTGRVERTQDRIKKIIDALTHSDWALISKISRDEALEMHSLFHTSKNPFTYWKPGTVKALEILFKAPKELKIAFTMDAGPNIHLLTPTENAPFIRKWLDTHLENFKILEDQSGSGGQICLR